MVRWGFYTLPPNNSHLSQHHGTLGPRHAAVCSSLAHGTSLDSLLFTPPTPAPPQTDWKFEKGDRWQPRRRALVVLGPAKDPQCRQHLGHALPRRGFPGALSSARGNSNSRHHRQAGSTELFSRDLLLDCPPRCPSFLPALSSAPAEPWGGAMERTSLTLP